MLRGSIPPEDAAIHLKFLKGNLERTYRARKSALTGVDDVLGAHLDTFGPYDLAQRLNGGTERVRVSDHIRDTYGVERGCMTEVGHEGIAAALDKLRAVAPEHEFHPVADQLIPHLERLAETHVLEKDLRPEIMRLLPQGQTFQTISEEAWRTAEKPLAIIKMRATHTPDGKIIAEMEKGSGKTKWIVGGIIAATVAIGAYVMLKKKTHTEQEAERQQQNAGPAPGLV